MKLDLSRKYLRTIFQKPIISLCTLGIASLAVTSTVVQSQEKQSVDPKAPELAVAVVRDTGEEIFYDVINGMAILENDIILGTHTEVQAYGIESLELTPASSGAECGEGLACSLINTSDSRKWPDGIVPFTIQQGTSAASRRTIDSAIEDWESKTPIRFVERSGQRDYIEFVSVGGNICSSRLGRSGGRQAVNFAGSSCLVHEIGHAMGLSHEQNRADRDDFVIVNFANIQGNRASQYRISSSTPVGPYDLRSVMHYRAFQFGIDNSIPTLRPRDPSIPLSQVGGVSRLSPGDVQGIEFVYGDSPSTPQPPTPEPPPPPPPPPPQPPEPPTPEPPVNQAPNVRIEGLTNGGTIPARTSYGDIVVTANDLDAGRSNGAGISSVTLTVSRDGRTLGSRRERSPSYDFGFRLIRGRTYTLTATAQSNRVHGGTSASTSVTVTAR